VPSAAARLAAAALRRRGYLVIPGYYTAERCIALRTEIDRIMSEQPEVVQKDQFAADHRVFGAEHASAAIAVFHDDAFLREVGEAYCGRSLVNYTTLAAQLTARLGNLGSGQGWHRDAFHFQYKAMVYLTDVGPENGAFEMLAHSHRPLTLFADMIRGRLDAPPSTRISDTQIEWLLGGRRRRIISFIAGAGTVILFDSSSIHRGSPIDRGVRYALTNYYYEPHQLVDAMKQKFSPLAQAPSLATEKP
jgi:ectoine hydroxylase-related dioxygenase (phytanoyl-CoA dioxygenase family)